MFVADLPTVHLQLLEVKRCSDQYILAIFHLVRGLRYVSQRACAVSILPGRHLSYEEMFAKISDEYILSNIELMVFNLRSSKI